MEKQERGVLYMVWGSNVEPVLQRSIASVKASHPELPIEVVRIDADPNSQESLLAKANIYARSPFRETLFLDADTIVLDRLDFGFEKARQFGLAICICEAPWARPPTGRANYGDIVEYNTGVIFFTERAKPTFDAWAAIAPTLDSSIRFYQDGKLAIMRAADQGSFALAVAETGISPFVLPRNWNFRALLERVYIGPIKIWHAYDPIPPGILDVMAYYRQPNAIVQNHIYHLPGDPEA